MADIRDAPHLRELEYAANAILVVTGLPGAGKSTLMRRCARVALVDSQTVRDRWAARLPEWIGYPLYRPLVRVEHYWGLRRTVRAGGPLVVHDSGTQPWLWRWLTRAGLRDARPVHLLVLAVSEDEALVGQAARGRQVTPYAQARHVRATRARDQRLAATGTPPPGFTSVVLIDRPGATRLQKIRFDAG
jgi:predicted kinase